MTASEHDKQVHTLEVRREIDIAAPIDVAFQAALEELGPGSQLPDGTPFPMKLEAWPGGRWFRDLGAGAGHLWGFVQVIKPPTLLELCGPMFMSYPAQNFVQYRLIATGSGARLTLLHQGLGLIPPQDREGVQDGWDHGLQRVKQIAEQHQARR